jgi:hypothetical protein
MTVLDAIREEDCITEAHKRFGEMAAKFRFDGFEVRNGETVIYRSCEHPDRALHWKHAARNFLLNCGMQKGVTIMSGLHRAEYETSAADAEKKASEAKHEEEAVEWRKIAACYRLLAKEEADGFR